MFCANSWFPNTSSQIMKEHKGEALSTVSLNTAGLLSISYVPNNHIQDYVKSKYSCLWTLLPLKKLKPFQMPNNEPSSDYLSNSWIVTAHPLSRFVFSFQDSQLKRDSIQMWFSLWHQITFRWHVKWQCQEKQQNIVQNFDHDLGSPFKNASAPRWNK